MTQKLMFIQWLCYHYDPYQANLCFRDIKDHYDRDLPSLAGLLIQTVVCKILWRSSHPLHRVCMEEKEEKRSLTKKQPSKRGTEIWPILEV